MGCPGGSKRVAKIDPSESPFCPFPFRAAPPRSRSSAEIYSHPVNKSVQVRESPRVLS